MDRSPSPPMDSLEALPQYLQFDLAFSADSEDAPSGLEQTSQNLYRLGSLAIDKFWADPEEDLDGFDAPLVDPANPNSGGYYLGDGPGASRPGMPVKAEDGVEEIPNIPPTEAVRFLRDLAQRTFGSTNMEPLKYEFLEALGQNRKACILTITRSNGLSRSYRTKPEFSRRSDAKIAAANSAIKLGAVKFIKRGDERAIGRRGIVLARLGAGRKKDETDSNNIPPADGPDDDDDSVDPSVVQVEQCCLEWRAGSVTPKWILFAEPKLIGAYGCALKISLSTHVERSYFVHVSPVYHKRSLAKAACAKLALEQDVLEFIKHGDGLENPINVPLVGAEASVAPAPAMVTFQAYQDSLPQPLPDTIMAKSNGDLNGISWVNTMVQNAKGSRMAVSFHWHTNVRLGLHGCLLNLARPDGPQKAYLVDAMFSKRADAKMAVCLYACSQGMGDYIRSVAAEVGSRITPEMRARCMEQITPMLSQGLYKIRHGLKPTYQFDCELATYGCTMTIDLPESNGESSIKREWAVPLAYRSKADARTAVLCAAVDDGLMAFVTSRGKPEGEGATDTGGEADMELEEGETIDDTDPKKKRKKNKKSMIDKDEVKKDGESSENKEEGRGRGRFIMNALSRGRQFRRGGGSGFGRGRGRGGSMHNMDAHFSGGLSAYQDSTPPSYPPAYNQYYSAASPFPAPGIPPLDLSPPLAHAHAWDAYSHEYVQYDYDQPLAEPGPVHERALHGLGGAPADTATSSAYAPPPVQPLMTPAYNGYHAQGYIPEHYDGHRDDSNSYSQLPYADAVRSDPQSQAYVPPPLTPPYGPFYSADGAAWVGAEEYHSVRDDDYHRGMLLEHDKHAAHLAHSHPRAYDQGYYAPEYDRIPEHSAAPTHYPPSGSRGSPVMQRDLRPQSHSKHENRVENVNSRPEIMVNAGRRSPPTGPRAMRLTESKRLQHQDSTTLVKPISSDVQKRERPDSAQDVNSLPIKRPRGQSSPVIRHQGASIESEEQRSETLKRLREQALRSQKRQRTGDNKEKSYVTALFDYCVKEKLPRPEICHQEVEAIEGGVTSKAFKVWIIMGKEKLELPTSFAAVNSGQERVAKSVLGRLKLQHKSKSNT